MSKTKFSYFCNFGFKRLAKHFPNSKMKLRSVISINCKNNMFKMQEVSMKDNADKEIKRLKRGESCLLEWLCTAGQTASGSASSTQATVGRKLPGNYLSPNPIWQLKWNLKSDVLDHSNSECCIRKMAKGLLKQFWLSAVFRTQCALSSASNQVLHHVLSLPAVCFDHMLTRMLS